LATESDEHRDTRLDRMRVAQQERLAAETDMITQRCQTGENERSLSGEIGS